MGLEFATAAQNAAETAEEVDEGKILTLNDVELRYYKPQPAQLAMVMTMTERRSGEQSKVAGLINFFFSVFDEDAQSHLSNRLWDRNDPFDVDSEGGINDIIDGLIEEWTGRPTRRSTVSTKPQPTDGPSSTEVIPASASSSSPPTSSATSSTPG